MQHIIKKQVIELNVNKNANAFYVQQMVTEHYKREIIPVLQRAFDEISSNDELISIDRLEIDLGWFTIKDIEKGRWEDEAYKRISAQLNLVCADVSVANKIKRQPESENAAEQWLFYMQYGYLNWSTLKMNADVHGKMLEAFAVSSKLIQKLRMLIFQEPVALKRIVVQHTENFLQVLIETLTAEKQNDLPIIIQEIIEVIQHIKKAVLFSPVEQQKLKHLLWQQALYLASHKNNLTTFQLAEILFKENIPQSEQIKRLPKKFLTKRRLSAAVIIKLKESIEDKKGIYKQTKEEINNFETTNENTKVAEEGIFVQHAGIVLLHPFLHIFFKNLELIFEEKFINETAQEKALCLLHYLATGSIKAEEHELAIAKILCSWDLQKPVGNIVELSTKEEQEADDLLKEVIQRWDVLKDTSPAGLREGFLQRNGKIFTRNDVLYIQVESAAIDVLLDFLPWHLHIVAFPWINDIIRIEWR